MPIHTVSRDADSSALDLVSTAGAPATPLAAGDPSDHAGPDPHSEHEPTTHTGRNIKPAR